MEGRTNQKESSKFISVQLAGGISAVHFHDEPELISMPVILERAVTRRPLGPLVLVPKYDKYRKY